MKIKTKNERMGCDGKGLVTWHNKWLSFHQQTRIQPMFTFVIYPLQVNHQFLLSHSGYD
jgi:molybdopterin-guanine dinucleotide biosynthesis protein A